MITKLLALMAVIALSITVSVVTLIFGWGLEPKSWAVIVFVGFFGHLFVSMVNQRLLNEITKENKSEQNY